MRDGLRSRWRLFLSAATVLSAVLAVATSRETAAAAEDPREVLAENGLVDFGDAWLAPAEVEVRRWLEALEPLERQFLALQRAVDERVAANEATKRELIQKRRTLKQLRERIDANDAAALGPTRNQLKQSAKDIEGQIERLEKTYKNGPQLAEFQPARDEVIRLANARAGLTLAAAALRGRLAELPAQYERLAKIPAVRAALSKLGPTHRLGTGKNYAADASERLARIDRATQSNAAPIYRDDNHARVLAIVDGAKPATFSVRHSNGPTYIPHSLATALGLSMEDAPRATYTVGQRKLACRRVKLSSVRIGGLEMRDVEALALPPEGEDLGAKLGRDAYGSHYFDVDYSHLRLTILSAPPEEKPAGANGGDGNGSSKARR